MSVVVGVDGARRAGIAGWAVVRLEHGKLWRVAFHARFADVLAEAGDARVVGVDMPVGHDGGALGRRACDAAAQAWLGPRRASVFPVPPLDLFELPAHAPACAEARARGTLAPSAQAWGLRERLLEVNALADARVREVHPECSFQAMLREHEPGAHLAHGKRCAAGLRERLALLHAHGLRPSRSFGGVGLLAPRDVLDASAAAWSAQRIAAGQARVLPEAPPRDPRTGRLVAIWA